MRPEARLYLLDNDRKAMLIQGRMERELGKVKENVSLGIKKKKKWLLKRLIFPRGRIVLKPLCVRLGHKISNFNAPNISRFSILSVYPAILPVTHAGEWLNQNSHVTEVSTAF